MSRERARVRQAQATHAAAAAQRSGGTRRVFRSSWAGRLGIVLAGAAGAALVLAIAVAVGGRGAATAGTSVGAAAPDGAFTTTAGKIETVAGLRGEPTLLWFVATWCSSCQAGTQAMASAIPTFAARHVRVVELELADDLGQSGPGIADFGRQLAGPAYTNPDWTFGVASSQLTAAYDAPGYLDVYYLLDASGRIVYVNGSPGSTMQELLAQTALLDAAR